MKTVKDTGPQNTLCHASFFFSQSELSSTQFWVKFYQINL